MLVQVWQGRAVTQVYEMGLRPTIQLESQGLYSEEDNTAFGKRMCLNFYKISADPSRSLNLFPGARVVFTEATLLKGLFNMSVSILSTIVLLSGSFVACNPLTGALLKRSAQPGIALNAGWDGSSYKCAPGSNPTRFDKYCCPNGYELNTDINSFTSFLCCPIGTNCRDDVLQCPRCADTEWTYWDINGTNVSHKD